MINLRHVRAFLAIVKNGSIRAAARQLNVSQPALSKTLRELETTLSVPLLLRSAQGVMLTEYGHALFARASVVETELVRAQDELSQMLGKKGGNVVIGLSPLAALLMGPEALARLWKLRPESNIRLVEGMFEFMVSAVDQGRLDFSIGPLPPSRLPNSVLAEPLFTTRQYPMVRKDHPRASATSLAELQDCRWIYPNADQSFHGMIAESFFRCGLKAPQVVAVSESFTATLELLSRTDLIGFTPRALVEHGFLSELLTVIRVEEELPSTVTAIVRRAHVPLTPLAELVAQEFRRLSRRYAKRST